MNGRRGDRSEMSGDAPHGLFDRPVLALDPGFHTAPIRRADVDAAGRIAVTGSHDRTVRVWALEDGILKRTIRLPQGSGNVGKVYSVALSPDGELVAVGGWTTDDLEQIYIFSPISGMLRQRIQDLPEVVNHLAFSHDCDRLAAVLGSGAMRLCARDGIDRWTEVAADEGSADHSNGVAFAADGRFVTTGFDGRLRLYDAAGGLIRSTRTRHARPFGVAFNPADGRLAVGFHDAAAVALYDGATLDPLRPPDLDGIDYENLADVAWASDGATLFAAGQYDDRRGSPVIAWERGGAGPRRVMSAGDDSVTSLRPLPDGALLVATSDPWLGILAADGARRWAHGPKQINHRGQRHDLSVSADGTLVEFHPRK